METHASSTQAHHGGGFGKNAVSFGVTPSSPTVKSNQRLTERKGDKSNYCNWGDSRTTLPVCLGFHGLLHVMYSSICAIDIM